MRYSSHMLIQSISESSRSEPDAPTNTQDERTGFDEWASEVRRLAQARNAVILAHNYQVPWVQDVADHVGDSLALSRLAARSSADVIVFCGVHFMAETAKLLAPERTVLLPDLGAGCSLADTIGAADVRRWREGHPTGMVVAYVNTSAAVKAESDICCTSSNAVDVVESLPEGHENPFPPRYVPWPARGPPHGAQTRYMDGGMPRPCRHIAGRPAGKNSGAPKVTAVYPPGMRLHDERAVVGRDR